MTRPETRLVREDLAIMSYGKLLVGMWSGNPTLKSATEMAAHYRHMQAQFPEGFVACAIVEDGVPLPDDSVRKVIGDLMKTMDKHIVAMCAVQEATGFRGSAIRSVLTALVLISRPPYKNTTLKSVSEAAQWLAPFVPDVTANQIETAIAQFRSQTRADRAGGAAKSV
jgi:hypothetical protein